MNGCRNQTSLSFAEWYQMERLLVAISLFHPGDRHTLRQTEDLNLRIGTATSVTCGCTSRLLMITRSQQRCTGTDFYGMPNDFNLPYYHKATVDELIEHFKGKENQP